MIPRGIGEMTMSVRCLKDKLKNDLHVRESVRSLL